MFLAVEVASALAAVAVAVSWVRSSFTTLVQYGMVLYLYKLDTRRTFSLLDKYSTVIN